MIRILHLITGLETGGAEMMLYKLLSQMDRRHFNNIVVSMTGRGVLGEKIETLGITVHTLGMQRSLPNPSGLSCLLKLLRKEHPHVLQTWLYHADLLGLLAVKLAGVPAVVWNLRCAELLKKDHPMVLFWILRVLATLSRMPKAVVVNSTAGRLAHEKLGYKPVKWKFIPNGFDPDLYSPSRNARLELRRNLGISEQAHLIGLVARFNPMKDHVNFLRAAGQLKKTWPGVHFVMIGKGVDDTNTQLLDQINSLSLDGFVHLLGERHDVPALTAALDIAASSSYSEGFSNVIGEAMACGVPCVVTDVGDSAYIVGNTGIVVPPRDYCALSDAWNHILSMSEDSRLSLGRAARERILSHFSINGVTRQYEKLYLEIVENELRN